MRLKSLVLEGFRSYPKSEIFFAENVTGVIGPNAAGKTNVLEALRLISVGDSFRASRIEEMVLFGEEMGRVEVVVEEDGEEDKLTVVLTRGEVGGKRVSKRRYLVNDAGKRKSDFVGMLPTVVFRPEDLEILEGSPSIRRKWLNEILSQTNVEYLRSLQAYEKALRRRNRVLEAIREGSANRHQLMFWDGLIIKNGQVLTEMRERLIGYINEVFGKSELFNDLRVEYDESVVSESRLKQYEREEVLSGYTLVGPHKDEIVLLSNEGGKERDLSIYGSRGEKRMGVLGLKMGELLYIEDKLEKVPILLLDDVFSELDERHSGEVLRVMKGRQAVVTTTDKGDIESVDDIKIVELS